MSDSLKRRVARLEGTDGSAPPPPVLVFAEEQETEAEARGRAGVAEDAPNVMLIRWIES
jgi:hypothetical protein